MSDNMSDDIYGNFPDYIHNTIHKIGSIFNNDNNNNNNNNVLAYVNSFDYNDYFLTFIKISIVLIAINYIQNFKLKLYNKINQLNNHNIKTLTKINDLEEEIIEHKNFIQKSLEINYKEFDNFIQTSSKKVSLRITKENIKDFDINNNDSWLYICNFPYDITNKNIYSGSALKICGVHNYERRKCYIEYFLVVNSFNDNMSTYYGHIFNSDYKPTNNYPQDSVTFGILNNALYIKKISNDFNTFDADLTISFL
jgi:hypothetical protein